MEQNDLGELCTKPMKAIVTRLEKIMSPENLPHVLEWHSGLEPHQRVNWCSPTSVIRHCPVFNDGKEKPERGFNIERAISKIVEAMHGKSSNEKAKVVAQLRDALSAKPAKKAA
jgi:hypothetical protein